MIQRTLHRIEGAPVGQELGVAGVDESERVLKCAFVDCAHDRGGRLVPEP